MGSAITLVLAMLLMTLSAQEPSFEVASIKVAGTGERDPTAFQFIRPGAVSIHAEPLHAFLPVGFGVPFDLQAITFDFSRIGRELLDRTYFDIQAKGDPNGNQSAMMQTLLRERFGMKWHKEVRTLPVYKLTVKQPGKLGPWLKPSAVNCREVMKDPNANVPAECRSSGARQGGAGTSADLVVRLQRASDIPIIDATGLKGNYAWQVPITWAGARTPEDHAKLRDEVEDQRGLKLTRTIGPWEVIVIDDLRMPTPN